MPTWLHRSAKVIQAAGMVSVQAACTVDEAVALMEERAQATNLTRREIADDVLARRTRFDPVALCFFVSFLAAAVVYLLGLVD